MKVGGVCSSGNVSVSVVMEGDVGPSCASACAPSLCPIVSMVDSSAEQRDCCCCGGGEEVVRMFRKVPLP